MVNWKTIDDIEKTISEFIIYFIYNYEVNIINCDINEKMINTNYGNIHITKEDDNFIIDFKNCIIKNNIILNKSLSTDICCICFDDCINTLNCDHYICVECAKSWLIINNSCPVCRNTDNFKKGYKFSIPINIIKISFNISKYICFPSIKKKFIEKKLRNNLKKYRSFDFTNYKYIYKYFK
jgi:hypothetical protein